MTDSMVQAAILKTVPLFALLSDEQLAALRPGLQLRSYSRNRHLLRAGEENDSVGVLLSGHARVVHGNGNGREITLHTIGPGEFFGEMGLIDGQPDSVSVEALDPCKVLYISKSALMSVLRRNFDAAMLILRSVTRKLREADRKIASLALMDVHGRVAHLIVELAHEVDRGWVVDTRPREIACMVGASREMVSRVIRAMCARGLIKRNKRNIIILDRPSMSRSLAST